MIVRSFRRDYRCLDNLLYLDVVLHTFRKKGFHLSDSCVDQMRNKYAVNVRQSEDYMKRLSILIDDKHDHVHVNGRTAKKYHHTSSHGPGFGSGLGLMSHSIGFDQSLSDISLLPVVVQRTATIAEKREKLLW